jgi:hypothetical protein
MKRLSAMQVHALKVSELGLDSSAADLTATESLAAALRRAAGLLCPCSGATLLRAVVGPLDGLVANLEEVNASVEATLEGMVAHGDILEQPVLGSDGSGQRGALLYAAPPSFLARDGGAVLLIGITPDERSPLPPDLEAGIEYVNHIRRLPTDSRETLLAELRRLGLVELSFETWAKAPPKETPAHHVARMDHLLTSAAPCNTIPGLLLLDPEQPVRYYRGRWKEPRRQTGKFVARRRQAYGADLWCYAELHEGVPRRFVDLPLPGVRARGCDEAWRLQLAIDDLRGQPQQFRSRPGPVGTRILQFFSPVPQWARRRWDAWGEPAPGAGGLFAYRFRQQDVAEEVIFMRENLWLGELAEPR